ncbi:MAG: protein kinase [Myxococcales bacterium]
MEGLLELDRIGKLIAGKYRLELVLGRGGMGTVYRATHTWTGRAVAVKYLHPDHAQDAGSVGRFLREARAAASVRHPNAVDVLDMGQDTDGSAYLVLEFLEGSTLGERLSAEKKLAPATLARLIAPVLEALEELHRAGVVHRDFKPANIFLARNSRGQVVPKLLDFGVAKVLDESAGTATTTGIVVGTPAYMAPEQAAGNGDVGPWTDLWAVGAVLYQCLVGELPFVAPTPSLMLVAVMTKEAPSLASKRPDLDAALCAVVDRALTKDPAARFKSAAEMAEALCKATGVELTGNTGPLPESVGSVGSVPQPLTSPATLAPPGAETIQLSSDSMMVPAVSVDAPTVAATPKAGLPAPLAPTLEAASADAGEKREDKRHWTGPSATGRLHAPRPGRVRLLAAATAAVGILAGGVWWLSGDAPATQVASDPRGAAAAQASAKAPEMAAIKDEAPAAPPTAAAAAPGPQTPALAPQPDASTASTEPKAGVVGEATPTDATTQVEPRQGADRGARPAKGRKGPRGAGGSEGPAGSVPAASSAEPAKASAKGTEAGSPPRVLREW